MEGKSTTIVNPDTGEKKTFAFDHSYWSHDGSMDDNHGISIPESESSVYADQVICCERILHLLAVLLFFILLYTFLIPHILEVQSELSFFQKLWNIEYQFLYIYSDRYLNMSY